jgi:hypothetical protein
MTAKMTPSSSFLGSYFLTYCDLRNPQCCLSNLRMSNIKQRLRLFFFFLIIVVSGAHYVDQAGFELVILLQLLECWDYSCAASHSAQRLGFG